jgi:hypothetical protein
MDARFLGERLLADACAPPMPKHRFSDNLPFPVSQ